jgi:uncharacterized membrane protein YkvA (DUF1232 family)
MRGQRLPAQPAEERPSAPPEGTGSVVTWLQELLRQVRLAWRLFRDPRVGWSLKLIPPAVLLYLLSPIDLFPDAVLGLGQLDDIAVLMLGIKLFIELCPSEVVREHLRALGARIEEWRGGEVIEGEIVRREPGQDQD